MKQAFYFLGIITLLYSCCNTEKKEVLLYPNKSKFVDKTGLVKIDLNLLHQYKDLLKLLDSINCEKKTPYIELLAKKRIKLIPINICPDNYMGCSFTKMKNLILINVDNEYFDQFEEFKIDSLYPIMERYYVNKNKLPNYASNPDKVSIRISSDSLSKVEKTKKYLIKISREFEKINKLRGDNLSLYIKFEKQRLISPPPPPPLMIKN